MFLDQPREYHQQRKSEHRANHREPAGIRAGAALERKQQEYRDNVLQQQHADDDFAGTLVMQHRGRNQLQTDDRARKHQRRANDQALRQRVAEQQAVAGAESEQQQRTPAGDQRGFSGQLDQLLWVQVQTEQEQQKDNADVGDVLDQVDVVDQV